MAKKVKRKTPRKKFSSLMFVVVLLALTIVGVAATQNRKLYKSEARGNKACKTVLFMGDSLTPITAYFVRDELTAKGYCIKAIVPQGSGSGQAVGSISGINWQKSLPRLLDDYKPSILVGEFEGNSVINGVDRGSAQWHRLSQQGVLQLVAEAKKRNIITYWAVPPKLKWQCNFKNYGQRGVDDFRLWVRNQLPQLEPQLKMMDWSEVISPGDIYTDTLPINGREVTVRTKSVPGIGPDCIHFTEAGSRLVASYVVEKIKGEWGWTKASDRSALIQRKICKKSGDSCCEYTPAQQAAIEKEYGRPFPPSPLNYYCRNDLRCGIDLSCSVERSPLLVHPEAKSSATKPLNSKSGRTRR